MGCKPGDIVDITFQFNWVTAGTLYDEALRMAGCAVVPGGAGNSAVHIQNMKLLGVTVLVGFPTFLEHLIDVARKEGVDPARDFRVRLVIFTGELRRSDTKKYLSAAFGGADVREHYATADVGVVAYECEYGGGMHLLEDQYVEVLDPETAEPVGPGQPGEVYVTSLKRRAMPIIRYRTWDLTSGLDPTACPCGASTPRLGYIIGRVGTIPRVKGLFVNPREVGEVLADFPQVGRFQLVVDRPEGQDLLVVRVEVGRAVADPHSEINLRARLTEALRNRLRLTPVVELVGEGTIGDDSPTVVDLRRV
jgi:phenylacetate-CoA ligase